MTVAALPSVVEFIENGVTTVFPAPFRFRAASDLVVERTPSDGEPIVLALGIDYAVTGGSTDAGGTVTSTIAGPSGGTLRIKRKTAKAQDMTYTTGDRFPAISHEAALDKQMLIAQEQADALDALTGSSLRATVPIAAIKLVPGKFFAVDANGQPVMASGFGADSGLRLDLAFPTGVDLIGGAVSGVQPVTARFVANLDGAIIPRLGDRVFAGGANAYDGNYPNDNPAHQDWFTKVERVHGGRSNGIIVSTQMAVLTNDSPGAAAAGLFAARTSNLADLAGGAVGLGAHVVNDNADASHPAWGIYSEAYRLDDDCGSVINIEVDPINLGEYHPIGPVNQHEKMSVGIQIANGGENVDANSASAAINIRDNGASWGAGIVFGYKSILGTDGATGTGNAMLLGPRQRIAWTDLTDSEMASVQSTIVSPANRMRLVFSDIGTIILGPTDNTIFVARPSANTVYYLGVSGGVASEGGPLLEALGGANADFRIATAGTGLMKFTNPANFVANGSQAMSLGATGPVGASPTPRKWWSIRDAAGAQFYIPAY